MEQTSYLNSIAFQFSSTGVMIKHLAENLFELDAKKGLSYEEYQFLDTLICYPHINKALFSKILFIESPVVDKIIKKLTKKKFLKETNNKINKIQTVFYEVTPAGYNAYKDSIPLKDNIVSTLLKFMTQKELVTFLKTMKKIRNILISIEN